MRHELKTSPEPFRATLLGLKSYEVRENDRPYNIADTLLLQEYRKDSKYYTGREIEARITFITLGGSYGLPDNLCVLGIEVTNIIED